MKQILVSKRAFTLIEIIVALIISSTIAVYVLQQNSKSNFYEEINKFTNTLQAIIDTAITDVSVGYPRGDGNFSSFCGSSNDYLEITAARVLQCVGWENRFNILGSSTSKIGIDSSFNGMLLLGQYTSDNNGCEVFIDDKEDIPSDPSVFTMFIDCSNIDFNGENRYKKLVEERIHSFVEEEYSLKLIEVLRNSDNLTDLSSGSLDDGKIRFRIKN